MSKTVTKSGPGPIAVILIFFTFCVIAFLVFVLIKLLYPEALYALAGGTPDERLTQENADLRAQLALRDSQLNASQSELGTTKAELFDEKTRKFAWAVLIGVLIIGAVLLYILWKYLQTKLGLTLKKALMKYELRCRGEMPFGYGFDEANYPMMKTRAKSIERTKRKDSSDKDERMYFMEFAFYKTGEKNAYVKGQVMDRAENVVTVAILNMSDEFNQQWYPFMTLQEAMKEAHSMELWGFHMQKTRQQDDVAAVLESAKNLNEAKAQFDEEATAE